MVIDQFKINYDSAYLIILNMLNTIIQSNKNHEIFLQCS